MGNTIQLKGQPIRKEGVVSEAMLPGHFVVSIPTTKSAVGSLAFPSAIGKVAQGIMLEYELEGKTTETAYAVGDNGLYGVFPKGSEVRARVAAGTAAIALGAAVTVDDDGCVVSATIGTHHVVGTAMEAVDNNAGGSVVPIMIEIA